MKERQYLTAVKHSLQVQKPENVSVWLWIPENA